jgi:hypothetical protein
LKARAQAAATPLALLANIKHYLQRGIVLIADMAKSPISAKGNEQAGEQRLLVHEVI